MPDETIAFKTEITQLLDILVHSLYTEREIFLRELLSNAADALYRFKLESLTQQDVADPAAELGIWIEPDAKSGTLAVRDTGRGMTREELVQNLGTIAHSGAHSFAEAMKQVNQGDSASARELIGRFGVGFYSVFMVAEEAEVHSRSLEAAASAAHWRSSGGGGFDVGPTEPRQRGTEVRLRLKEDAREYLEPRRLREIVRTHSNYLPFPIYLREDAGWQKINDQTAIWRERPASVTEEQHRAFLGQLRFGAEEDLLTVHLQADVPLQFYALLYVPARRDAMLLRDPDGDGLRLYARKVLIDEHNRSLLPRWLRFMVGVVDAEDLPLNVSRETVQATPVLGRIGTVLTKRVVGELVRLASEDRERFDRFLDQYGPFLKEAIATDPGRDERIPELLRFHTTRSERTSLEQVVERMKEGQQDLYYVQADDEQAALASPHLEPFQRRGLEVLILTEPLDAFLPMGLPSYRDHPLRDVGEAGLELPPLPPGDGGAATEAAPDDAVDDAHFAALLERFHAVLGDRVAEVRESRWLERGPARLVAPAGMPAGVERLRRLTEEDYRAAPRVLELNRRSDVVRNLARRLDLEPHDGLLDELVLQLFETQLLVEGLHPNPATMAARIERLLGAASLAPSQTSTPVASEARPAPAGDEAAPPAEVDDGAAPRRSVGAEDGAQAEAEES